MTFDRGQGEPVRRSKKGWTLALALAVAAGVYPAMAAGAAPPTIDGLLRPAEFEDVQISPRGDYLALRMHSEGRTVMAVMRRADGVVTTTMAAGEDGHIDDVAWIGDERLLASWSKRVGRTAQPYAMPTLQVVDVDGGNRQAFDGWVADPMNEDPDRVLVVECMRETRRGCLTRLREIGVLARGKPVSIADGPVPNAQFLVDRKRNPVFSWATDSEGYLQTFLREGDDWVEINNERYSGVALYPQGVGYDMRHGHLRAERTSGPDVIERIDLATGQRTVIASDPDMDPSGLVASFDQREVIGARYGRGAPVTRYFDESHPHVALSRELEREFTGMRVRVTSATRDGALVVVFVDSDREPGRYYLLDVATGELQRLLDHREWIHRDGLAARQPVEFTARDGRLLEGYLTRPVAGDPAGAPLVVLVHGGPHGVRDQWGFDVEAQMLAARGFAVMQVNFRGSGGRGRAFMESGYLQWGTGMIEDIIDGTRWARQQAGVSPGAPCIWGASYGGYAALMATIREPALFRCAVGVSGPYDLPTLHRRGDIQETRWGRASLARYVGTDEDRLRADSPTRHAGAIRAGLMLVHGGRDRRVPSEHATFMRGALDRAGKPYEWFLAKDETHGFYDLENEREYYTRVLGFLERHLAGAGAGGGSAAAGAAP